LPDDVFFAVGLDCVKLPPQALRLHSDAISARAPNVKRNLRRRAGTPKKNRRARNTPPVIPRYLPLTPGRAIAALAANEFTVTVAVSVGVEEFKVQLFGDEPTSRGLARAHETHEREIHQMSAIVHAHELAENRPGRTPNCGDGMATKEPRGRKEW